MTDKNTHPNNKVQGLAKRQWKQHPILSNAILMVVAIPVMVYIGLLFVDLWTHHGAKTVVPNVKDLIYNEAMAVLDEADLKTVIGDSIYDLSKRPGQVVDVYPKPGAVVKPGREVYLTIVSFSPQQFVLDVPLTDTSSKQAVSYLKSHGIRNIHMVLVPSDYEDLVLSIKADGKPIRLGDKIPVTATIVLEVGKAANPVYETIDDAVNAVLSDSADTHSSEEPEEPDDSPSMFD